MPRDGAIIFRDIVGKLDVLNVECDKCGRRGRTVTVADFAQKRAGPLKVTNTIAGSQ
jgi:hypothetical protein